MENFILKLLIGYYKILQKIAPKFAGDRAFKLFQKVRKKDIREREQIFYQKARHFKVPFLKDDLHCYELGDVKGELIFLVHGWDSNAGSLTKFAFELAEANYRVISFDLPGHARSKSEHTNLYECREAFTNLLAFIKPEQPFTVIAHSFGSAMTAYTLSKLNYKVDKFVFLTTPNSLFEVFNGFKNVIGITEKTFSYVLDRATAVLNESVHDINVEEKLQHISFTKLLLMHDKHDKIIPFRNSEEVYRASKKAELKSYEKIGHYRMLWNDKIVEDTMNFIRN